MKKLFILAVAGLITIAADAQSLERQVIASQGGEGKTMEWSIGQPNITTYRTGESMLTQGFHQPAMITISATENKLQQAFEVFPNPFTEGVNIKGSSDEVTQITLTDAGGRIVKSWKNIPSEYFLDLNDQPPGLYMLMVFTHDQPVHYQIVKANH